jgi:hypothetical protein
MLSMSRPPRRAKWGGGLGPRGALGRHPSAGPRRWRPASGPVAGAQMGIEPFDAKRLWHRTVISDNSKLFHQIICSPKTAWGARQGPVGAADPWLAVNNILSIPHTFVESGHSAGNEPRHEHQAPNC